MTGYRDIDEDEEWVAALTADGWAPMEHAPINPEVDEHIRRCFGEPETVLHEHLSKYIHLDINVIPPSRGRTFTTYVTSGMSDVAMKVPAALPDWARAELVIALPGPPEDHVDENGRGHYLIDQMRAYARRPHAVGTFFMLGHTVGPLDDDPIGPDTQLSACVLSRAMISPIVDSIAAFRATLSTGECVNFLALEPIYADELDLKQKRGSDALIERLEAAQVFELYDPGRASVAPQKFNLMRMFGRSSAPVKKSA
jgi:hypothetical protein